MTNRPAREAASVIVIQAITTTWTKASRGAPVAQVRANVPDGLLLPEWSEEGEAWVHEVRVQERESFKPTLVRWEQTNLPVYVAGTALRLQDDLLKVERMPDLYSWPPREHARMAFQLRCGDWGRALRNGRSGLEQGWQYQKVVVNIGWFSAVVPDAFTSGEPHYTLDEQASLR